MKNLISFLLFFATVLLCYSQNRVVLHGKVVDNDFPLKDVDIINYTSMKTARSDANGKFDIMAKDDDELIFVLKSYEDKKIAIRQKHLEQNNLTINLTPKTILLKEVHIEQGPKVAVPLSVNDIKLAKMEYRNNHPTNPNVYTGEIINGIDFVAIAKNIASILKRNKKKPLKTDLPINFREMVNGSIEEMYFIQNLKISPDQHELFLEFCEKDPKAKTLTQNQNLLELMDFLLAKSKEFSNQNTDNKIQKEQK